MPAPKHLSVAAVKQIHSRVIHAHGGDDGLRDEGLLESAIAAPQATFAGEDIMADHIEIAAAYLFYLCNNHPFVDGNKRTALAACLVFLVSNEVLSEQTVSALDIDTWERLILNVACSKIDRGETTKKLRDLLK
ncbi:MAG: Fic family protein [Verrucomicrobiota bacterium]